MQPARQRRTQFPALSTRARWLRRGSELCAVAALICVLCAAQIPISKHELNWREDLTLLSSTLARHQTDFEKLYPELPSELSDLQSRVARMTDAQVALEVQRLVASAQVAHNSVLLSDAIGCHWLPLQLHWYSDGLAVIGAAPQYASAIGTHVVRIGQMSPEQALGAITPWISHENDAWLRMASSGMMTNVELLREAGIDTSGDAVELTLTRANGPPFTIAVTAEKDQPALTGGVADWTGVPNGLARKHPDSFYWYEYLGDANAIYIQYNRCANDPKLPFKTFAAGLFLDLDADHATSLILDLRFNGGGDGRVLDPLKEGLKNRPLLRNRVYVLIGAGTFSAAKDEALLMRQGLRPLSIFSGLRPPTFRMADLLAPPTGAILIGEPAGEKLNQYGNVKVVVLPHSKLAVFYTTQFFRRITDGDPAELLPDISAPMTLADALAGRDAALEFALTQITAQRH